ncbi:RNA polymerase sigma factor [Olleya sp. AH-315-F22]|nr:RNA polymerase sigma factor [Olleya sp. AH-315-F22]
MKVIQLYRNEAQLIKKAKHNHREAQRILYDLYATKMLSVCRYYIIDLQHAEDVMLNGFFKVFTKLKDFKQEGSFEGWIRRIMIRESISFLRQKKQTEFSTDEVEVYDEVTNIIKTEMEVEEIQLLIDNLPEGYRKVFVMFAIEGYKHNEIAELLNISEGTSKSQLFKARKLLQQQLIILNKTSNGTN